MKLQVKQLVFVFPAVLLLLFSACASPAVPQTEQETRDEQSVTETPEETENVSFRWKDAEKSVIKTSSWGPRVYTTNNGILIAGYETLNGIRTRISEDNGQTWQEATDASFRPDKTCANVNFFEWEGRLYLAYRATGEQEDGIYTSLQVSVSEDHGKSWAHHSTIAEYLEKDRLYKGVWEPYLGEIDGRLTCFYANDFPELTPRQNIESLTWNGEKWADRQIISSGMEHDSRDGMPVWTKLSDGGYALAIESTRYRDSGHPFVIQLLYSNDGKRWSEPVDVYIPKTEGSKAGAPGIAELPSGQLVISFQTDEDASEKGDATSVMKTIVSNGTPVPYLRTENFTAADNVFDTPDGENSIWSGIWYADGYLYATASTMVGSELKKIKLF